MLTKTQVSQLYVTIFNRASEGEGHKYWQTNGGDMISTANHMLNTQSAQEYFGNSLNSNQSFIEHLYKNTFGKTINDDPDGIAYWTSMLDRGETRAKIIADIIWASQQPENADNGQLTFNNKVEISNYMASKVYNVNNMQQMKSVLQNVNFTQTSVNNAKNIIDQIADDYNNPLDILVIGQSNIANYGIGTFTYQVDKSIKELGLDGNLYNVSNDVNFDTLTTGYGSNMMGIIGNKIISETSYDSVNFYNVAVGGTKIAQWLKNAPVNLYTIRDDDGFKYQNNKIKLWERIEFAKEQADKNGVDFPYILICIGESDAKADTSTIDYKKNMLQLLNDLNSIGLNGKVILSKTSYIEGTSDSKIINAQTQLINENSNIYAGPNTDAYVNGYRYGTDNLHFNEEGLLAIGAEWAEIIDILI